MNIRQAILGWKQRFRTAEESAARDPNISPLALPDLVSLELVSLFRTDRDPVHTQQFLKAFYPFYRKATVFGIPSDEEFILEWPLVSFLAGYNFGERHSGVSDDLFESDRIQADLAWSLLTSLRNGIETTRISARIFAERLRQYCERIREDSQSNVEKRALIMSQRCVWAGMLASTAAKEDVLHAEFIESIPSTLKASRLPLHFQALIESSSYAREGDPLDILLHPLLDVASEKYSRTPLEANLIIGFLNRQLDIFGHCGERDCPTTDCDIAVWVKEAMAYAQDLAATNKELLFDVFAETGGAQLPSILTILQDVLGRIRKPVIGSTAHEIQLWHSRNYGRCSPRNYGDAIDRVVECVDLAIWLAWEPELRNYPTASSKLLLSI